MLCLTPCNSLPLQRAARCAATPTRYCAAVRV